MSSRCRYSMWVKSLFRPVNVGLITVHAVIMIYEVVLSGHDACPGVVLVLYKLWHKHSAHKQSCQGWNVGFIPAFAWIVAVPLIHNDYIGHTSSKAPDLCPWDLCCPNICDFNSVMVLVIHAHNVVLVLVRHSLIKFSNRNVVTSLLRIF